MANGLQEVCLLFLGALGCRLHLTTGAADTANHKIYIWDLSNAGQFATTLDGGREPLMHLHVRRLLRL